MKNLRKRKKPLLKVLKEFPSPGSHGSHAWIAWRMGYMGRMGRAWIAWRIAWRTHGTGTHGAYGIYRELDWEGKESFLLLHAHLPTSIQRELETMSLQFPPLEGHFWLMSSLSTAEQGTLKFVALSKKALLASAKAVAEHLEVTARDRWFCALPPSHVGGLSLFARSFLTQTPLFLYKGPNTEDTEDKGIKPKTPKAQRHRRHRRH